MFDIFALDWGTVRSGLAFGSSSTFLVLSYSKELMTKDLFEVLEKEVLEKKPTIFLVGLPSNFKREKTETTVKIEEFCEQLACKYPNIKIVTQNENGTSQLSKLKTQTNKTRTKENRQETKHQINHLSAKTLCEAYFDKIK
jgi:RNase H-fold protein (predicted Holliday junction resolvase)